MVDDELLRLEQIEAESEKPSIPGGFGAIQSPPDERDFPIEDLFLAAGITPQVSLAASYVVPLNVPVLNQGTTPQCVAYSSSSMKSYQDYDDQHPHRFWNFDESLFFRQIGGTSQGAYLRNAMDRMLHYGYPVVSVGQASKHKIKAYYAISKSATSIKQAVLAFGEIVVAMPWYHSWMHTQTNGVLPRPDYQIGGHAIVIRGWNDSYGLRMRNSWGSTWGVKGDCYLPYAYIVAMWEAWKSVDQ